MIKYVCLALSAFIMFDVQAQENSQVDCDVFRAEIVGELSEPATCFRDDECHTVSWGCPWQPSACHLSIYSDADKDRNVGLSKKISRYEKVCVNTNQALKKQCDEFKKQANTQCKIYPQLMCLQGKCVTPVAGILQGAKGGEDIYGSREIIEE